MAGFCFDKGTVRKTSLNKKPITSKSLASVLSWTIKAKQKYRTMTFTFKLATHSKRMGKLPY